MSKKIRSNGEDLILARNTLEVRDPDRQTIVVGSVAIVAQLYERGVEAPIGCDDVDVLCSEAFFDSLLATGPYLDDIDKFQVRWPKGRLRERGATNKSIDLYPRSTHQLGFTACHSMSDLWYPIDYESCVEDAVVASDIRCIRLGHMLEWLAVVGREKDTNTVEAILPIAEDIAAIDADAAARVKEQLEITYNERAQHPERYYARVDS